jgi:hypothetical protein
MRYLTCLIAVIFTAPSCLATVIQVPSEQPTIQTALDVALSGDTIEVLEGCYCGNIHFNGVDVVVRTVGTVIVVVPCGYYGFRFQSGESPACVLDGFVITQSYPTATCWGPVGGISIAGGAAPTIRNCVITGFEAHDMWMEGEAIGVLIESGAFARLVGVTTANFSADMGSDAGVWCDGSVAIEQSTITGYSFGLRFHGDSLTVGHSIIIVADIETSLFPEVFCSDLFGLGGDYADSILADTSNFSEWPSFCGFSDSNVWYGMRLTLECPCAPQNNPCGVPIGAWPVECDTAGAGVPFGRFLTCRPAACGQECGDTNGDGIINVSDGVYLISYIFSGGSPPDPFEKGDVDLNGIVNVSDAVYLLAYIFAGGPPPCEP